MYMMLVEIDFQDILFRGEVSNEEKLWKFVRSWNWGLENWKVSWSKWYSFDFGATIVSILINCRDNFTSSYFILAIVGDK